MKLLTAFILSATFCSNLFAQDYSKRLKGIDKELNALLELCDAAGFAVAVVDQNEIVYAKGFGYRDYENKIPVDEHTMFAIGSCTKAFTAGLLGQLREEDKLSFNDKPSDHIQGFKFYNDEMNQYVNIKDMMCHRTGLPRHDWSWYFFPSNSRDSLIKRIEFHEPFTGVRKRWYYNNFMYLAQGVIAENITGKSWETNIEDRFFKPLGMTNSSTTLQGLENSENASLGYSVDSEGKIRNEPYYRIAAMAPAGSINSSVSDMAKWLAMWINGGKHNEQVILPMFYVNEATAPQMIMSPTGPSADQPSVHFDAYGYGWMMSSYKGHYQVEHGGNIDGFSASTAYYPTDSVGIIVLTNQSGSSVTRLARNILSDRLLELEQTDWTGQYAEQKQKVSEALSAKEESSGNKKSVPSAHDYADFTGDYHHDGYGTFSIELRNDSLFAILPNKTMWLRHDTYDIFEPFMIHPWGIDTTEADAFRMNFSTNNAGDISAVKMLMEEVLEPMEFKHLRSTIDLNENDLQKYIGTYELMGTEVKVYNKKGVLYVLVPGQPEYELQASEPNIFLIKVAEGFSLQFNEENDKVTEVLFIQPNGTFKATKKE